RPRSPTPRSSRPSASTRAPPRRSDRVPFGFFRKSPPGSESKPPAAPPQGYGVPFEGLTEEWRLAGVMHITGRLSDALNPRDAVAFLGETTVSDPEADVVLVNRFYLRGVEQIDRRTGTAALRLPGRPLGGVSYTDRSR